MAKDPVCGMDVDEDRAVARLFYRNEHYYFCTAACKRAFERTPEKYTADN